ncbi:MAG: DUF2892 domain-containing protein [Flavobacteriia bacterium]|nr:MAG: DUF2892 domain-containing protein [Flavobacteriia bacterium]
MKKNVGSLDKIIRIIIALVAFYFAYDGQVESPWNWVLYAVGTIMLLTALLGTCPIFSILGMSTCKNKKS